ncbi:3',5'-cyclic AMP phosphodiesterase CpdA [Thermomonospora echinospora]|uniref:3',5'-cyclic AMP phosphodiesterase CpdA n=1 Tax=Thermomonospora echinospora TaxID=1992 RepID=A0A1H6DPK6_9ACTN|nr:metallophosphoesterase [Thermomonospora echinospora]SEG87198.1 3',5'-cyclic AMP phosphodiesterase CpdA [Thermomonospora echinospora]
MLVFAQLSDLHLDGGVARARRAEAVLRHLTSLSAPLDAVLVTGDIADHGLPAEYEQARKALACPYPVLTCPGNHDARAAYRRVLLGEDGGTGPDAPINRVHRVGSPAKAVFALCDSTIPGHDDGRLTDETLHWLDSVLAEEPGVPAFVCFHHPPVVLHAPYVDEIRQFDERRLADVIARHPQVVAVLCGHAHTAAATTFAGRPCLVAPAVASTVRLAWERGDPLDHLAPPAVAFHILDDQGRLTTHHRVIT